MASRANLVKSDYRANAREDDNLSNYLHVCRRFNVRRITEIFEPTRISYVINEHARFASSRLQLINE